MAQTIVESRGSVAPDSVASSPAAATRWLPFIVTFVTVAGLILAAGTGVSELARYCGYAAFAVVLPGTLVYRALRPAPKTLVEDLAMGAAVGLTLELAAWAAFSVLDLRGWLPGWPLLVVAVFLAAPRLRRHWRVRYYERTSLAWSWSLAAIVIFWSCYLFVVFLDRNPVVPTSEGTMQYLDLSYQLSLAGEAKNHLPLHVPQVAGEPLYYHWFAYAHMAMASLVGGVDLAAVSLRFAIPALCALAIVLTAVVGWRVSRKPWVGIVAAALFFAIGEFNFTDPVTMPFGTQAAFVIWHGMSMIYSWVLLIALIGVLVAIIDGSARTWRGYVLAALLIAASSGAKASSLPIVLAGLALAAFASLVRTKRIPWPIVILGAMAAAGQFFAIAVLYRFQTYATGVHPFGSIEVFAGPDSQPRSMAQQAVITGGVLLAYFLNMQLRLVGIVPLLRRHRLGLEPAQWLLLGGALGGIGAYLLLRQLADGQQYFVRSGFAFGVILSAWGFVEAFERARLGRRGKTWLGVFAAVVAAGTIAAQLAYAQPLRWVHPYDPAVPILRWAAILAVLGVAGVAAWYAARDPVPSLRGRGGLVFLTAVLVVGAPGLVMDMVKSARSPNGGAYTNVPMPRSRVEAARWVRDHSSPADVLATNVHCLNNAASGQCDPRSFWLSAYAERRVLVEGWTFAPRLAGDAAKPFWDPELLDLNDRAFTEPTTQELAELRQDGVRWLVADSRSGPVAPELASLAVTRYSDGPVTVYELR
jgi:hypothetical protein